MTQRARSLAPASDDALALEQRAGQVANETCPSRCHADKGWGKCGEQGRCECVAPHHGEDCGQAYCEGHFKDAKGAVVECGGHGSCSPKGKCLCEDVFEGPQCFDMSCPGNCSSTPALARGYCARSGGPGSAARCFCRSGFSGETCERSMCPGTANGTGVTCSGHGACDALTLRCNCDTGYGGAGCSESNACDVPCVHGTCFNRTTCRCTPGYIGNSCEMHSCGANHDCNGHGKCSPGDKGKPPACTCTPGFAGVVCEDKSCPPDADGQVCGGHGECSSRGVCLCGRGWRGGNCDQTACPRAAADKGGELCSGHGACPNGNVCKCTKGFAGVICEKRMCPTATTGTPCSGHGDCDEETGSCSCDEAWQGGKDCSLSSCPMIKAKKGRVVAGVRVPYKTICGGHGTCPNAAGAFRCSCESAWSGETCLQKACRPACANGACVNGMCACAEGWGGAACDIKPCVVDPASGKSCGGPGRGKCANGTCACAEHRSGPFCENFAMACANNCSGHGTCDPLTGACACAKGFVTPADAPKLPCSSAACPTSAAHGGKECGGAARGVCHIDGKCACGDKFYGDACEHVQCDVGLHTGKVCGGQGTCDGNGTCACKFGYAGLTCEQSVCGPPGKKKCGGHGTCEKDLCECADGWVGEYCGFATCPTGQMYPTFQCSGHGKCGGKGPGKCLCEIGFEGAGCGLEYCANGCHGHGKCNADLKRCLCSTGFTGDACEFQYCSPMNCGGHGTCDAIQQKCKCELGFRGASCDVPYCPAAGCGGHGTCSEEVQACKCDDGWSRAACTFCATCAQADVASRNKLVAQAEKDEEVRMIQANDLRQQAAQMTKKAQEALQTSVEEAQAAHESRVLAAKELARKMQAARVASMKKAEAKLAEKHQAEAKALKEAALERIKAAEKEIEEQRALAAAAVTAAEKITQEAKMAELVKMKAKAAQEAAIALAQQKAAAAKAAAARKFLEAQRVMNATKVEAARLAAIERIIAQAKLAAQLKAAEKADTKPATSNNVTEAAANEEQDDSATPLMLVPWFQHHGAKNSTKVARESAKAALEAATGEVEAAKAALEVARASGDKDAIKAAEAKLAASEAKLAAAEATLGAAEVKLAAAEATLKTAKDRSAALARLAADEDDDAGEVDEIKWSPANGMTKIANASKPGPIRVVGLTFKMTEGSLEVVPSMDLSGLVKPGMRFRVDGDVATAFRVITVSGSKSPAGTVKKVERRLRVAKSALATAESAFDVVRKGRDFEAIASADSQVAAAKAEVLLSQAKSDSLKTMSSADASTKDNATALIIRPAWSGASANFSLGTFLPRKGCGFPSCGGHGMCAFDDTCVCNNGFSEETDCHERSCPKKCSERGDCKDGSCYCFEGFSGDACQNRVCPDFCNNNGRCTVNGTCACFGGFQGVSCRTPTVSPAETTCPMHCSGKGTCQTNGTCACVDGHFGMGCELLRCPGWGVGNATTTHHEGCSGHGTCAPSTGSCACRAGFDGPACETRLCEDGCSKHGDCVDGACVCAAGFKGKACNVSVFTCPTSSASPCSGHGRCDEDEGVCYCKALWVSEDCSKNTCKHDCFNGGECIPGAGVSEGHKNTVCKCKTNFEGEFCETRLFECPLKCSGHGRCNIYTGQCRCAEPWKGQGCASLKCLQNCHGNGACNNGTCACNDEWTGALCQTKTCSKACSGHGLCENDLTPAASCTCDPNWAGKACGEDNKCPTHSVTGKMCSDRGVCKNKRCMCKEGWTGTVCEERLCSPPDCSGHGLCAKGICQCKIGYAGSGCDNKVCPMNCTGHGKCLLSNRCDCEQAWSGDDCATPEPVDHPCKTSNGTMCNNRGVCLIKPGSLADSFGVFHGECECDEGYGGRVCTKKLPPTPTPTPKPTPTPVPTPTPLPPLPKIACPGQPMCSGHGACEFTSNVTADGENVFHGACACTKGWRGDACGKVVVMPKPTPVPLKPTPVPAPTVKCERSGKDNMMCGGHGVCFTTPSSPVDRTSNDITGRCLCDTNSTGRYTEISHCSVFAQNAPAPAPTPLCPVTPPFGTCAGHGECIVSLNMTTGVTTGQCKCKPGWQGNKCAKFFPTPVPVPTPPPQPAQVMCEGRVNGSAYCSGHGACAVREGTLPDKQGVFHGECVCQTQWAGKLCGGAVPTHITCPKGNDVRKNRTLECGGRGKCIIPADATASAQGILPSKCLCDPDWFGMSCTKRVAPTLKCPHFIEAKGGKSRTVWEAVTAQSLEEKRVCSGHGSCLFATDALPDADQNIFGKCGCFDQYTGMDCANFAPRAAAVDCPKGLVSVNSTEPARSCGGHGVCTLARHAGEDQAGHFKGECDCTPGWTGHACTDFVGVRYSVICHKRNGTKACSGHGTCDARDEAMPNANGLIMGSCRCAHGWQGVECKTKDVVTVVTTTPKPLARAVCEGKPECTGHGVCAVSPYAKPDKDNVLRGSCRCNADWAGRICDTKQPFEVTCPRDATTKQVCSGHGQCAAKIGARLNSKTNKMAGECVCEDRFTGTQCGKYVAVRVECGKPGGRVCGGHGACTSPIGAVADERGIINGQCKCDTFYAGKDCITFRPLELVCPKSASGKQCSGFGRCTGDKADDKGIIAGTCMCDDSHRGKTCEQSVPYRVTCPTAYGNKTECGGHGVCAVGFDAKPDRAARAFRGNCNCETASWQGPACSKFVAPKAQCPGKAGQPTCGGHGLCKVPTGAIPDDKNVIHGECKCAQHYLGEACSRRLPNVKADCSAQNNCHGHGACVMAPGAEPNAENKIRGVCKCDDRYASTPSCKQFVPAPKPAPKPRILCPRADGQACNGHGMCTLDPLAKPDGLNEFVAKCDCKPEWSGAACTDFKLAPAPFKGVQCPKDAATKRECTGRGVCAFPSGAVPDVTTGVVTGECKCTEPFFGKDCSKGDMTFRVQCPTEAGKPCNGHGACAAKPNAVANPLTGIISGECVCTPKWAGAKCATHLAALQIKCPLGGKKAKRCSGHGDCVVTDPTPNADNAVSGKCVCHKRFDGKSCETKLAEPKAFCGGYAGGTGMCSGHGNCLVDFAQPKVGGGGGICECEPGYSGDTCDTKHVCPFNKCSGNGVCDKGLDACVCNTGFSGDSCGNRFCGGLNGTKLCHGHGACNTKEQKCKCERGYTGILCDEKYFCPWNKCAGHGECDYLLQKCVCATGFKGKECGEAFCGTFGDCAGHGKCNEDKETCECRPGYSGKGCSKVLRCPFDTCNGHGACDLKQQKCLCKTGFDGRSCEAAYCGQEGKCSGHGACDTVGKACKCNVGFMGANCTKAFCGPKGSCHGHGACDVKGRKCKCAGAFGGVTCELPPVNCPRGPAISGDVRRLEKYYCSGHGQCTGIDARKPTCVCDGGWLGTACHRQECRPACVNGTCNFDTGRCTCNDGFTGSNCSQPLCPNDCNTDKGQGKCAGGVSQAKHCACNSKDGWGGVDCSEFQCAANCSGHGKCDPASLGCKCAVGWEGGACDVSYCKLACNLHGKCSRKKHGCECDEGWKGQYCTEKSYCPWNTCSGHGKCDIETDKCACGPGYLGLECQHAKFCPRSNCSDHGACNVTTQKCACKPGYKGIECDVEMFCPRSKCSGHGRCDIPEQKCICEGGYKGRECQVQSKCPFSKCGGHGKCDATTDACRCDIGWAGPDCSDTYCPKNCSSNGICDPTKKACVCKLGYSGIDCGVNYCPDNPLSKMCGHGKCSKALKRCVCNLGFKGDGCDASYCPKTGCGTHGKCSAVDQKCKCETGWQLSEAEVPSCAVNYCPKDCSGHGRCDANDKKCTCETGWRNAACDEPYCGIKDANCSNHGVCNDVTKLCECATGFGERLCTFSYCGAGSKCTGNGECDGVTKACKCNIGFLGRVCDEAYCGQDGKCNGHGKCDGASMECKCMAGYIGDTCLGRKNCPFNKCSGHGNCNATSDKCACFEGYGGANCEVQKNCPFNKCNGHGRCDTATDKCQCTLGYEGPNCGNAYCGSGKGPALCSANGQCDNKTFSCDCNAGFRTPSLMGKYNDTAPCTVDYCTATNGESCSGHGKCDGDLMACACAIGFRGKHCGMPYCGEIGKCSGHGRCDGVSQKCSCEVGWGGSDCKKAYCGVGDQHCSGHGVCDSKIQNCSCVAGWKGSLCSTSYCGKKSDCGGHGVCNGIKKQCVCEAGFKGPLCAETYCGKKGPLCGGHGQCNATTEHCDCGAGFSGALCETYGCGTPSSPCSGHGDCSAKTNKCKCLGGYDGPECLNQYCAKDAKCNAHGSCNATKKACDCSLGFHGDDCAVPYCSKKVEDPICAGHGNCDKSTESCNCTKGFGGMFCSEDYCGAGAKCNGHGTCFEAIGGCNCTAGWEGTACKEESPHAKKIEELIKEVRKVMKNDSNVSLAKVAEIIQPKVCPGNCTGHGKCDAVTGKCDCKAGWGHNDFCSKCPTFPPEAKYVPCSGHGQCNGETSTCKCAVGWGNASDPACVSRCPGKGGQCSGHGTCDFGVGKCACDKTHVGPGCATLGKCPKMCSGHGECGESGKCACEKGFGGDDACAVDKPCPNKCSGHGKCQTNGTCTCAPAFVGTLDCRDPETKGLGCPSNCSGHGECQGDGKCLCDEGFKGAKDCRTKEARGLPPAGTKGFCPSNCSAHGECSAALKCTCDVGFDSTSDCRAKADRGNPPKGMPACPFNCNEHGVCDDKAQGKGECTCDAWFAATPDCRSMAQRGDPPQMPPGLPPAKPCPNKCSGNGICDLGGQCAEPTCTKCTCDKGFMGTADCSKHTCPNNCNGHGECISGKCSCLVGFDDTSDCQKLPCPKDCSGHGTCAKGMCTCDKSYRGTDCAAKKETPAAVIVEKLPQIDEDRIAAKVAKQIKLPALPTPAAPIIQMVQAAAGAEVAPTGPGAKHGETEQLASVFTDKLKSMMKKEVPAAKCPNDCSGHGTCLSSGKCQCQEPYTASEDCAKAPASLEECSVCCTYQCVNKCKPKLAESGQNAYLECYNDCSTGTGGDGRAGGPASSPFEPRDTAVDRKDVEKFALDDIDGSSPASQVVSSMSMVLIEEHARAHSVMRRSTNSLLASMSLDLQGRGSCMSVCTDGQHPDVSYKCHKTLSTADVSALPAEISKLVQRMRLS